MERNFSLCISGILSVIVVTFVLVNPATGKEAEIIAQRKNCINPGSSNVEWKECAYKAYKTADRRLNQVYRKLYNRASGNYRRELIKAQRAWIKFRDTNCSVEVYHTRKGTDHSIFLNYCLKRMTKERTRELERYIRGR